MVVPHKGKMTSIFWCCPRQKKLAICHHFEFNYILNLYVLSMCFMLYHNWIGCAVCNAATTLFLDLENFEENFGNILAPQVHTLQYHDHFGYF